MTNTRHLQLRFTLPHCCPPRLPPPHSGPPFAYTLLSVHTPPFYTDRWVHKGVSASTISTPSCLLTPFAQATPLPFLYPCHDPDALGHGTCTTTVCYHIVSLSSVPFVPPLSLLPHSGLIYDNTPLDLFQLCLVVSRFVVPAL